MRGRQLNCHHGPRLVARGDTRGGTCCRRTGPRTKNLVPTSSFLRRNPHLMAIQSAIGEAVRAGHALSIITPKHDRVIRTEVVHMPDGVIHGVPVDRACLDVEPPTAPDPGSAQMGSDLRGRHRYPGIARPTRAVTIAIEATHGRAFAEDLPARALNPTSPRCCPWSSRPNPGTPCAAPGM